MRGMWVLGVAAILGVAACGGTEQDWEDGAEAAASAIESAAHALTATAAPDRGSLDPETNTGPGGCPECTACLCWPKPGPEVVE